MNAKLKPPHYTIDELFADDHTWARLHDVLLECGFGSVDAQAAKQVFFELPETIKIVAFEWGIGDTVFGDLVAQHLTDTNTTEIPQ